MAGKYKEIARAYVTLIPHLASNSANSIKKELNALTDAAGNFKVKPEVKGITIQEAKKAVQDPVENAASKAGNAGGIAIKEGIMAKIKDIAIGNILANAITAGAAKIGNAVKDVFAGALNNFANYEQLTGGVSKIFGDSASQIKKWSDDAYKTAQMSANDYMELVTSFSSMLIGSLGGDTEKAAELANMALSDIADNYNTFGGSIESISGTYSSLARGSYAMLDNLKLGYGGTMKEMARMINDSGVLGEDKIDLNSSGINEAIQAAGGFATMVEAIHATQQRLNIEGTTARESMETVEGSLKSAKAMWDNWITALGRNDVNINAVTDQLIDSVMAALEIIVPRFRTILGRLGVAIENYMPEIAEWINEYLPEMAEILKPGAEILLTSIFSAVLQSLPGMFTTLAQVFIDGLNDAGESLADEYPEFSWFFENIVELVSTAIGAFVGLKTAMAIGSVVQGISGFLSSFSTATSVATAATEGQTVAQQGLNTAMKANPIMAIISIITTLISVIITLYTTSEDFRNFVDNAFEFFKIYILWVLAHIKLVVDDIVEFFTSIPEEVGKVWDSICQFISDGVDWFLSIPEKIGEAFGAIAEFISAPFRDAFKFIIGLYNDTLGNFEFTLPDWIPFAGGETIGFPKIDMPALAEGGIIKRPTTALIGEAGAEAVIPLESPQAFKYFNNSDSASSNSTDIKAAIVDALHGWSFQVNGDKLATATRDNYDKTTGTANILLRRGLANV